MGRLLLTSLATLLPLLAPLGSSALRRLSLRASTWQADLLFPPCWPAWQPARTRRDGNQGAEAAGKRPEARRGPGPQPGKKQVLLGALTPARHVPGLTAHQGPSPIKKMGLEALPGSGTAGLHVPSPGCCWGHLWAELCRPVWAVPVGFLLQAASGTPAPSRDPEDPGSASWGGPHTPRRTALKWEPLRTVSGEPLALSRKTEVYCPVCGGGWSQPDAAHCSPTPARPPRAQSEGLAGLALKPRPLTPVLVLSTQLHGPPADGLPQFSRVERGSAWPARGQDLTWISAARRACRVLDKAITVALNHRPGP